MTTKYFKHCLATITDPPLCLALSVLTSSTYGRIPKDLPPNKQLHVGDNWWLPQQESRKKRKNLRLKQGDREIVKLPVVLHVYSVKSVILTRSIVVD